MLDEVHTGGVGRVLNGEVRDIGGVRVAEVGEVTSRLGARAIRPKKRLRVKTTRGTVPLDEASDPMLGTSKKSCENVL